MHAWSKTGDFALEFVAWVLSFLGFEKDCCPCGIWIITTLVNINSGNVSITNPTLNATLGQFILSWPFYFFLPD